MQAWLPVEQGNIAIQKMPFNYVAWLQLFEKSFLCFWSYFLLFSIRPYDIIAARIYQRPIFNKEFYLFDVPFRDHVRHCKLCCNFFWNANFIYSYFWIRRY